MDKFLLEHIKNLEKLLDEVEEKENKLKKISFGLKKLCQPIMQMSVVNQDTKEKVLRHISTLNSNLEIKKSDKMYEGNTLNKGMFFRLLSKIEIKEYLFFIFRLRNSSEIEFASSFIESKFSPFLSIDFDKILGIIPKKQLKDFENTKFIPFFKDSYKELDFFVTFFELENFNIIELNRMNNIFDRFYLKPSFQEKRYVYFSLSENKIIDFEAVEKEKIKKEYSFVYDMKYPELDLKIRKEIKNIQFILTLLDRIDTEMEEIKQSKGTIMVVKRILHFIQRNQPDIQIQEMVGLIYKEL